MNRIIMDTHTHTKASDGTFTPEESVRYARDQGIEIMAKTDHDTTFGNAEAICAGEKFGVKVIPGIEIKAEHYDSRTNTKIKGLEVLGLNVDSEKIQPFENKLQAIRISGVENAIANFNEYIQDTAFSAKNAQRQFKIDFLMQITLEDVIKRHNNKKRFENPHPFISQTALIEYILENCLVPTHETAQILRGDRKMGTKFREEYEFLFTEKKKCVSFYEAITAIHEAGGKAVLAHPGRSEGYQHGLVPAWRYAEETILPERFTPMDFIADLARHNLDGIEIYNYSGTDVKHEHEEVQINSYFKKIAEKYGLFVTYGSDCHGEVGKGPQLGRFGATTNQAKTVLQNLIA